RLDPAMEMSVWRVAGSSPLAGNFCVETVGSDSSSATKGSSVTSVAGKKRLPANPCPNAGSQAHQLAQSASQGNDARTYRARDAWDGIIPLSHGWTWSRRRLRPAGVSEASAQTRAHRVNTRLRRAAERNASGLVERRTADGRRRYRVACVERLDLRGDLVSIADDRRHSRHA